MGKAHHVTANKKPMDISSWFFLFLFLLITVFSGSLAIGSEKNSISFYNPETNINNFASLKNIFDQYLSSLGAYSFQAFNKKNIFEELMSKKTSPSILILSSWHFRSLKKKLPLTPSLISVKNGKYTYKKILIAGKKIKTIEDLQGTTIASSASRAFTISFLRKMLGREKAKILRTIKILTVPKDIDALFSIQFGAAQGALITEFGMTEIERINPNLRKKISILLKSNDLLMPILTILKQPQEGLADKKIITIFKEMKNSEKGKEILALFSIDGWQELSPELLESLKQ